MPRQPTMTIVVNRQGQNGRCSHCNQPAKIDTDVHACGARATQLAIEEDMGLTLNGAKLVAATRSDLEFVGTGRIEERRTPGKPAADPKEYFFRRDRLPGDLR
ncbi:MAG TPA: hypothetical protein VIQ80_01535 [Candidatus Saccharimonadales bacterium]